MTSFTDKSAVEDLGAARSILPAELGNTTRSGMCVRPREALKNDAWAISPCMPDDPAIWRARGFAPCPNRARRSPVVVLLAVQGTSPSRARTQPIRGEHLGLLAPEYRQPTPTTAIACSKVLFICVSNV